MAVIPLKGEMVFPAVWKEGHVANPRLAPKGCEQRL